MNELENLESTITKLHANCFKLLELSINHYLPVSGNIGIFCQSQKEYANLLEFKNKITNPSNNPNQKYFELLEPITIEESEGIPSATYTHLYIRKPDPTPYGENLGDIDFVMDVKDYEGLKLKVQNNEVPLAQLYDRPGWDTIQITKPEIKALAYISTKEFAEKVRVKFD